MSYLDIKQVRYDSLVAQSLVAAAMAELGERYGEGDTTPVYASDFDPPDGVFLVAYLAGKPAGCAGWRSHGDDGKVAELKRVFTVPSLRGQGVARKLLAAVEDSARVQGRVQMILECGDRQPEAIALYKSTGYQPIESFGHYRDFPEVQSLGRDL